MNIETQLASWLSAFTVALVTFWIVWLLTDEEEDFSAGGEEGWQKRREWHGLFLKTFGKFIEPLGQLISKIPLGKSRAKLQKKLVQAGRPGGLSVDEFHASRIICVILAFLAGSYIDFETKLTPLCAIALGFLGFIYPDIWLTGRGQTRIRRIFRDLPDVLDLLRLAVDAGLDLSSAMKVVVEKGRKGPLIEELEKVEREIALGRTRKEAFKNFSDRLATAEINAFVLALIQADQLGASIGPLLRVQSSVARTRRWQLAETLVNKMPMKLLGPLVLFIFPSSFIILFTPLVIQYMQGGM